jgi:hypothetical protein
MEIEPPDDIELELVESTDGEAVGPARTLSRPGGPLDLAFSGELWYWRGPAPFHFVTVPPDAARAIHAVAADVTYGCGMIPVGVRVGASAWETALWPKDGGYVVPIKDQFRKAEAIVLGEMVAIQLVVRR